MPTLDPTTGLLAETADGETDRLSARAAEIADAEAATFAVRTTASKALYERALRSLPLGVPSSFQAGDPYPIYIDRGQGSQVWDVDANQYVDFHGGFGVGVTGHCHPKIATAIAKASSSGTHFAAPTPVVVELAEELCPRS